MAVRQSGGRGLALIQTLSDYLNEFFAVKNMIDCLGRRVIWQPFRDDGSVMFKL
jgi:hypothetical protein